MNLPQGTPEFLTERFQSLKMTKDQVIDMATSMDDMVNPIYNALTALFGSEIYQNPPEGMPKEGVFTLKQYGDTFNMAAVYALYNIFKQLCPERCGSIQNFGAYLRELSDFIADIKTEETYDMVLDTLRNWNPTSEDKAVSESKSTSEATPDGD